MMKYKNSLAVSVVYSNLFLQKIDQQRNTLIIKSFFP